MKKTTITTTTFVAILLGTLLSGCLKDSCYRTFTMYKPVYKARAEVRANIKNNPSINVSEAGKMFVLGNYIFLNEVDKGIHVIDNSNPAAPINKYFINIPGNVDVAVKGNILYADMYSDLVALDISDPNNIRLSNVVENVFSQRQFAGGFVADQTMMIVDWEVKDTTIDCSNNWVQRPSVMFMDARSFSGASMAAPTLGVGGSMARFALLNQYLYTVTESAINVFDVSQPVTPILKNTLQIGWGIETIYPFKNNLFIGSNTGMFIFNTVNAEAPQQQSMFSHATVCDPVIADDQYAYVTLRSGTTCRGVINQLDVINITNLQRPTLVRSYAFKNPHGLSKDGNLLFICDGTEGLKVFDAANVNNIQPLKTLTGFESFDVIAANKIAIVSAKDGLYQFSYADVNNIRLVSKVSIIKK